MTKRAILTFLAAMAAITAAAQTITGFSQPQARAVVFNIDTAAALKLSFFSPSVVKVEYAFDGDFTAAAPTPAVICDELEPMAVNVSEAESRYEIFTGAMRVSIDKNPVRIRIYDNYQKLICCDESWRKEGEEIFCTRTLARDEQIFGLGEKGGEMNRRGGVFMMWNSDKPCYCIDEDPLYKSIPFFISSKRYGVFFDNSYKSTFDFSARKSYTFSAEGGDMIYYIITGEDYKDILGKYILLTGKPVMPPKWALGFSQCRGLYTNEALALEVAQRFRELRIPCDVIYQDIGWTQYLQDFQWRQGNYQDPVGMLARLKEMGYHVIVSQDPVISQRNERQWADASARGILATDSRTGGPYDMPWPWGGNCGVVDFTNPDAAAWWGDYQQKAIDDGVSGFWTDMGEPAWSNEEDTDRLYMQHFAGPHAKIHNVYGLYWDRVVTEEFYKRNPNKRLFQMTRACFSGMQRYTFSWTGDSGSDKKMTDSWEQFGYQIPMMLSAGLGGIPFITGDITGYCGTIDDYAAAAELYIRWMQFGLFTPLSRSHHEGNTAVEPWQFGEEAVDAARRAIELKYSLMPYIYTIAREAYDTGVPLMRAMFLEFPSDRECRSADTQFMFGSDLLVAPVIEQGARQRSVYLPKGYWYDWYSGERYSGGRYIEIPVALDRVPLFVREGGMIATTLPGQYIGEDPSADIVIKVFPRQGRQMSCRIYEDDGETLDYQKDIYTERTFLCTVDDGRIDIVAKDRVNCGGYALCTPRKVIIDIPCDKKPRSVTLNGARVRRAWNRKTRTATVVIAD
ncbi:MAG: glycoside hydrolase family 31 protein [Bacteroidales bacterium]|nr:glycoside hydrolase family 31 protein [Bacteroidales bacterium]